MSKKSTTSIVKPSDLPSARHAVLSKENQKKDQSIKSVETKDKGSVDDFYEIIPYRGIGELRVGMKREELPQEAQNTITDMVGIYRDIEFALEGDVVEDVWITNVRKFPNELRFNGQRVLRDASIEALKNLFGPCTPAEKGRGGALFNCKGGVTLGLNCERSEDYVQIRIKPR